MDSISHRQTADATKSKRPAQKRVARLAGFDPVDPNSPQLAYGFAHAVQAHVATEARSSAK